MRSLRKLPPSELPDNRTRVNSVSELRNAVRSAGRSVALLVQDYDPSQGVTQQRIVTVQLD